jgi:hypothetical protein
MNRAISAITITAISAILLAWAPSTAYAGNNAADVIMDSNCLILFPWEPSSALIDFTSIQTESQPGVSILICQGSVPPNPDGKPFKESGFLCVTDIGITDDTKKVISPTGKAILTCKVKTNV